MLRHPQFTSFLTALKPWAIAIALFLVLRYTGALSSISFITQTAMMKAGVMDAGAGTAVTGEKKDFDYNFKLLDLDKKEIDAKQFRGKTIFLNIWATWCGPCRVEMPSIQKLYDKVDHDKIVFIMLALDQNDPFNKVSRFVQEKNYTFPVYLPSGDLPSQLRVPSIPVTMVIDPQGKIVSKETGAANYDNEQFRKFLESLF